MSHARTPPGQKGGPRPHPDRAETAKKDIPVFFGISERTAGAAGLSLNVTAFPPGGFSNTHKHDGYETAIDAVDGAIEFFYGERLEHLAGRADRRLPVHPGGGAAQDVQPQPHRARDVRHRAQRPARAGERDAIYAGRRRRLVPDERVARTRERLAAQGR